MTYQTWKRSSENHVSGFQTTFLNLIVYRSAVLLLSACSSAASYASKNSVGGVPIIISKNFSSEIKPRSGSFQTALLRLLAQICRWPKRGRFAPEQRWY